MLVILNVLIILAAAVVLVKGVSWFIGAITKIAHYFNVSTYTISFFLVALATSLPETFVAITSALNKTPILSFGNALGANITMMTLVAGISAVYARGISTRTILNSKDAYYAFLFLLLPLMLLVDGTLSRIDGIILLCAYIYYIRVILHRTTGAKSFWNKFEYINIKKEFLIFILSVGVLLGTTQVIVRGAISLSENLAIGLGFIGLTITAIGTSLPEMTFSIASIKKGNTDQILGNVLGSIVANSTFVLGVASVIYPINVGESKIGMPTMFILLLIVLVFLHFSRTKKAIERREGVLLVGLYFVFVAVEFVIAQGLVF